MALRCPKCNAGGSLRIDLKIELPGDSRSDEIALQIVKCSRCGFAGVAVYEESRRGSLDSESVDHAAFDVSADDVAALSKLIRRCPDPRNSRCRCAAHRKLGRRDARGRWAGLSDIDLKGRYPLQL